MTSRSVVLDFFDTWSSTGVIEGKYFTDDLIYEGPASIVDASVWLMNSADEVPIKDLFVIGSIITDENASLLFEGVDVVTSLTYRFSWYFCIRNNKIFRVTEVRQHIQSDFRRVASTRDAKRL